MKDDLYELMPPPAWKPAPPERHDLDRVALAKRRIRLGLLGTGDQLDKALDRMIGVASEG